MTKLLFFALAPLVLCAAAACADDDLTARYREVAGRIVGAAMKDEGAWEKLTHLTTVVGHRLSGSQSLEQAIDWASTLMREEGLDRVERQPVMVPHWVRGEESAIMTAPTNRSLAMLGLGGSIATPEEGIEAEVVVVESFDQLDALGRDRVEGKIVVYAVPWNGYGRTVQYRSGGASRASAHGAVAVLVRSATGSSLYTPHTGGMRYGDGSPKIPAAAITVEDAEWMKRLAASGATIRVQLKMSAKTLPDAESANVIAEITGSELPDEVVVMGGHIDSWDVGQGAHDDGAACIAAWHALALLKDLGLQPRRTLRVVLWTNEENGVAGGRAYAQSLGKRIGDHVAAIEMDSGVERPIGFGLGLMGADSSSRDARYEAALEKLQQIGNLLEELDAGAITRGGGGADIGALMRAGVPGLAFRTEGEHYFDWHHTRADTLDKVDPENLRKAVAMLGVMGFVLADMPERLVDG